MYRTYRELYRSKVEIVSIGMGPGKIRLPKGIKLGLDIAVLGAVAAIFPGIPFGLILQSTVPALPKIYPIYAMIFGILIALAVSKADPAGKTMTRWLWDSVVYLFRNWRHDGWGAWRKSRSLKIGYSYSAADNNTSFSSMVVGTGDEVTLFRPLGIKVNRNASWSAYRSSSPLPPGHYRIVDGQIKATSSVPRPIIQRKGGSKK